MPARQTVTFEDPVTNTEAFYKLVEVRPRVIKHKIKVRPQVEGYEVSVGGGYTAPCQPGPLQANYYDDYCNDILTSRRSRAHFLDDHAIDGGYSSLRHSGYYLGPRAVTGPVVKSTKVTKAITDYSVADDLVIPRPRLHAVGDSTINVSKRTIRY